MTKSYQNVIYTLLISLGGIALSLLMGFNPKFINLGLIIFCAAILIFLVLVLSPKICKDNPKNINSKSKIKRYFAKKDNQISFIRQTIVVLLFGVFLTRFMLAHDYLESVVQLNSEFLTPFETVVSGLLNVFFIASILFVCISEFIKSNVFDTIVKFLVTPITLLSLIFMPVLIMGICGNIAGGVNDNRMYFMAVELGVVLAYCIDTFKRNPSLKIKKERVYALVVAIILMLLTSISDYLPRTFFGESFFSFVSPMDFNFTHRILVYLAFLLPIFYFALLYPFDINHRRAFLAFIAFNILFSYIAIQRIEIWTHIYSLPLHLCNTAMYIVPLTLAFKSHKVFYFTMFINVIGAFIALLMPNYSESTAIFAPSIFQFYNNHLYAFFMPVLIVMLGIYERPKLKYFGYSMVGFLFYFILVLFVNAYCTAHGNSVDFFFLNSNYVGDKLGDWATDLFNQSWSFKINDFEYVFHPAYQIAFYLTYVLLALGMWFVYELLFGIVDEFIMLADKNKIYKESKIRFLRYEKERGINMKKIHYDPNVVASLEISHLEKRYGNSKNTAVKDFSINLEAGKIYGFLGKNGAGKSTIIKSIVGMHTFNSGRIAICGYDIEHQPIEAKECIGFVPDHYALYENLTGRQYINYIADLYGVTNKEREERLNGLLDRLGMKAAFDKQMKTYSHGMKQKITIIGALIHNPKIWILDEPMTGVDPNSIFEIKECMREHAKKGNIVFFSSHLIDVVNNLCDEVIMIRHGDFVLRANVKDLKKKHIDLESLFLEKTADSEEEAEKFLKEEEMDQGK
jgi:ABC-2 type transport system ATP-binding protein